jgi:hypothetical protein
MSTPIQYKEKKSFYINGTRFLIMQALMSSEKHTMLQRNTMKQFNANNIRTKMNIRRKKQKTLIFAKETKQ